MEGREGLSAGVTVIGAEAPSNYHVAPRNENPGQIVVSPPAVEVSSVGAGLSGGTAEKKKRGRPRKYGPDGAVSRALSPMPISASAPSSGGDYSAGKPGKVWPGSYEKKKYKKLGMENLGEWASNSVGTNFTPHVITVNAGEDVTMKVISFSQQGPRAICILSANGVISNVTLRQPDSSGGTLTYEGRFEILSLSGSFMPTENQGTRSRSGGMSVSLASPDGRVVGGSVAGLLVAASPVQASSLFFFLSFEMKGGKLHFTLPLQYPPRVQVTKKRWSRALMPLMSEQSEFKCQAPRSMLIFTGFALVVVGSFLAGNHQEQKPKKPKVDSIPATFAPAPAIPVVSMAEREESVGTPQGQQNSSSFQKENWATMHSMQDVRNSGTDINISLPEG
ncbi:hypothetical protein DKX38_002879 [Salix brachista]|uniref:AT-hook motif nuclear-localized protein n=1 Tax=Salix brachista TaxID=2182728 RepID=A0A5N5NRY6_9ROSI|nr:hypothetical protein DKX38_002879 [Salix brachista]